MRDWKQIKSLNPHHRPGCTNICSLIASGPLHMLPLCWECFLLSFSIPCLLPILTSTLPLLIAYPFSPLWPWVGGLPPYSYVPPQSFCLRPVLDSFTGLIQPAVDSLIVLLFIFSLPPTTRSYIPLGQECVYIIFHGAPRT